MREMFRSFASLLIRITAFLSKEFLTVLSQPRLVGLLILGPFLILLIFGISYRETFPSMNALIVIPEESRLEETVNDFLDQYRLKNIDVMDVTTDGAGALGALKNRTVDIVVIIPNETIPNLQAHEQSVFTFYHRQIDPFQEAYIGIVARQLTDEINKQLMLSAIEQAKGQIRTYRSELQSASWNPGSGSAGTGEILPAGSEARIPGIFLLLLRAAGESFEGDIAGIPTGQDTPVDGQATDLDAVDDQLAAFLEINSRVIVEPFTWETENMNPNEILPQHYYIPAVLAMLVQHIAISLASLSIVSERLSGSMEMIRATPVHPIENLLGKYLSFLALISVIAAALTALVVWGLRMPLAGSLTVFSLIMFLIISVSLGLGFLISTLVKTESQAIQFSMVILLASIFFSGLFIPLFRLLWPAQIFSWSLPASYGIQMLQDNMLRGVQPDRWMFWVLGGAGIVLFLINWFRLRILMLDQ